MFPMQVHHVRTGGSEQEREKGKRSRQWKGETLGF
jgi:hypothetical protein